MAAASPAPRTDTAPGRGGTILAAMEREEPGADTAVAHLPAPRPIVEDIDDAEVAADVENAEHAENADTERTEGNERTEAAHQPSPLGARERAVLDFEVKLWRHAGAKEEAIRTTFGMSATSYYQILNALLDDPAALAYRPTLVARLRRIRDARRDARG